MHPAQSLTDPLIRRFWQVGPFDSSPDVLDLFNAQGRMHEVTLSSMKESGFTAFAWVHPSELIGDVVSSCKTRN